MKKSLTKALTHWITSTVLIILGILCIVADNADGANKMAAYENISLIIGIVLISVSSLALIASIVVYKRASSPLTIGVGTMLAAGIYFVVQQGVVATLLTCLFDYVPYFLVVAGSLAVADGLLIYAIAVAHKADKTAATITCFVTTLFGAVAIVLGVLALPAVDIISAKFTIFGIILIIAGIYSVLAGLAVIFFAKKVEEAQGKDSIDAEVKEIKEEE